jgi:hypothetical protein
MPAWDPETVALIMRHGPLIVMLALACGLYRSLGSWPVYLGVIAAVLIGLLALSLNLTRPPTLRSFIEMMFAPTLLFVLARRQLVPGLRRGRFSEADRMKWLAHHAFSPPRRRPASEQLPLVYFARDDYQAGRPI